MGQLLTWAEVDTAIQNEMRGESPSETKRLDAMQRVLLEINTEYDIEQTKRTQSISVKTDGETAYDLSALVSDDDVKKIHSLRYPDLSDSDNGFEYRQVDHDTFIRHIADGLQVQEFTVYYENGIQYFKVNDYNHSTTEATLTLVYFSTYIALNGSAFTEDIAANVAYKFLMPRRFINLVTYGACSILYPMALGKEGDVEAAKYLNKHKSQIKKMGLDNTARKTKKPAKKVKVRPYK